MAEFWAMTPKETFLTIDAYLWRRRQDQRESIQAAWLTAALMRSKRLPPLTRLLTDKAKPLKGPELERRRQEFQEMSAGVDLEAVTRSKGAGRQE